MLLNGQHRVLHGHIPRPDCCWSNCASAGHAPQLLRDLQVWKGWAWLRQISCTLDAACVATLLPREQQKMLNEHAGAKRPSMLLLEMKKRSWHDSQWQPESVREGERWEREGDWRCCLGSHLRRKGEYDVSIATIRKQGKAESNNDYNKIRRGHTDHQIVPPNLRQSCNNSCLVWKRSVEKITPHLRITNFFPTWEKYKICNLKGKKD